jgi:two-component system chemotaxis sensor kinase CheA
LGNGRGFPLPDQVPPLDEMDPADGWMAWVVELSGDVSCQSIEDVFVFCEDADLTILPLSEQNEHKPEPKSTVSNAEDPSVDQPAQAPNRVDTLRIPSGRVDRLMDDLGELVIAQSRLSQLTTGLKDPIMGNAIEEFERLLHTMRETVLSMRMLPVESIFGRFRRVVRDLSQSLGKDVTLHTLGGETEVDKNVLDRLTEPLVHMLRNALDHGLETREERIAAGKPGQGGVYLAARQEGGEIILQILDDGRGLDADRIQKRGVQNGLIDADDSPTEETLFQLIFNPGFSTAEAVSDVSGRGVGMDAVQTVVDALGGNVSVRSRTGEGAAVTLRLPVSLAVVDGLRVRLGRNVCVLPLASVEECVEIPSDGLATRHGQRILDLRGDVLPLVPLEDALGWPSADTTGPTRRVVIVRADGQRTGLIVDDILGQSQTVVKPLSILHLGQPGLSGATIMGDGSVAMILDVAGVVQTVNASRRVAA